MNMNIKKRSGLIATKIGNSSFFDDNGKLIPVSILRVEDCIVSGIKTIEKNGYTAIQLASIENEPRGTNIRLATKRTQRTNKEA